VGGRGVQKECYLYASYTYIWNISKIKYTNRSFIDIIDIKSFENEIKGILSDFFLCGDGIVTH